MTPPWRVWVDTVRATLRPSDTTRAALRRSSIAALAQNPGVASVLSPRWPTGAKLTATAFGDTWHRVNQTADDSRAEAADRADWLAGLPGPVRRRMALATVRCRRGEQMLSVYYLPSERAGPQWVRVLVVPTAAARADDPRHGGPWWLTQHAAEWTVRCRCSNQPITLEADMLRGRAALPEGVVLT